MNIFAIADLHLSMSGEKPMDIYGGQWIRHTERLQENWGLLINEEDTVIIAGDTSWALKQDESLADLCWLSNLPGKKVLIKGNHDLWWTSVTKLNSLFEDMYFLQNTYYSAGNYAVCGSRGWTTPADPDFSEHDQKIYRREVGRLKMSLESAKKAGKKRIIGALHYPPAGGGAVRNDFTSLFEEYGVDLVVYGHLHGADAHQRGIQGMHRGVEYRLVSCDHLCCSPLFLKSIDD